MQQKRHHYVSQFYLAAWTDDGTKTGKFTVTEVKTGKQRPGTPNSEANIKDFYTIEDRQDPLIVENQFSKIEDEVATLIRRIAESENLPSDPAEMELLLYWLALQHQKVLRMREVFEGFYDELGHMLMKVATQSDEVFEQVKRGIESKGASMKKTSRKGLLEALPNLKFKRDPTALIQRMLEGADVELKTHRMRRWCLLIAPKGTPEFVASDNPVSLVPSHPGLLGVPLGFAMPGTSVLYPLMPRLAVCGEFSDQPARLIVDSNRVSEFNGFVVQTALRYVYSRRKRFYYRAGRDVRWTYKPTPNGQEP